MQFFKDISIQYYLYSAYAIVLLIGVILGLITGIYPLMALPLGLLVVYVAVVDFRKIFYLLIACIPFSTEIHIPGAFSVNLPSEPLIIGLTLICIFYVLGNLKTINGRFFRHPLMLVLLLHLGWMFIATLNSELFLVSVKFFTAKIWYVLVFVVLSGI